MANSGRVMGQNPGKGAETRGTGAIAPLCSIHLSGREVGPLASSALKAWFGIWSSTLLFVLFLVTGYIDSASQKQVVAVIQKISPIR